MIKHSVSPRSTLVPVAGERTSVRLVNGAKTDYITLVARATFTTAAAALGAILNRGSLFAAFDEIVLDENGKDQHVYRGNVLRFLSEMSAPSALTARRLTSTAIGVYQLEEAARIYFAHPMSLDPSETAYVERDSRQSLSVSVRMAANPGARLATPGGGGTGVLSAVTVSVIQGFEAPGISTGVPLFLPTARQIVSQVNGASSAQIEYIRTTNLVRGIVVSQETATTGEVDDIINALTFRGDFRTLIGPTAERYSDILLESEFEFGGAVISSNRSHLGLNFQRYGRLSECLNPAQDANLRFEFDAQPSVAGTGASSIRITLLELVRDPAITAAEIPFSY